MKLLTLLSQSRCNDRILNTVNKVTFALVYQQYISPNLRLLIGEGAKYAKMKCGQNFLCTVYRGFLF